MFPFGNMGFNLFMIIVSVIILLVWIYYLIKKQPPAKNMPNTSWQEYASFRDSIKSGGFKPEKVVSYGNMCFAYDEAAGKIFIKAGKTYKGVTLNGDDVASFELYRDGKVIEPKTANPEYSALLGSGHTEGSCFDLHITITAQTGSEIILPLIDSPVGYEYAYTRALNIANDITAILKEIINERL